MIRKPLLVLAVLAAVCSTAYSQNQIRTTDSTYKALDLDGYSRDFWFSLLLNYEDHGGKYYQMYVAAEEATRIYVSYGDGIPESYDVAALAVQVIDIPLFYELKQSGVVQSSAIHVWSEHADIAVSVLSRNPATSDGFTALPTASLSTDYIVASYASYAYLPGYEFPSEFAITATEDSTLVTITPSTDLRQGFSSSVAYTRNVPFTVMLHKGQAVQYMVSAANGNMTGYDVTGSRITSDKPIAVIAGVQCANIPADKPYCDHICEMLLPIDRWGTAYYSAPFARRVGGDTFLAIAAEDNTQITRVSSSGSVTFATLNAGEFHFQHDIDKASHWYSDKPFMLVQYCNSTDFPETGSNNGVADPAMIVLTPVEAYTSLIVFQTPKLKAGESSFANYANIVVHKDAVNSTTFDGKAIGGSANALQISGVDHVIYRIEKVAPGSHIVRSDSAFGVYTYGFGSYDAYGWPAGGFGSFAVAAQDVAPPSIIAQGDDCSSRDVRIVDNGVADGYLNLSTSYLENFEITLNSSGAKNEVIEYTIEVLDPSKVAIARLEVSDDAGNRRVIEHRFDGIAAAKLPDQPVQVVGSKTEPTQFAIPVQNTSAEDLTGLEASLSAGVHFSIVSAPSSLDAGETDSVVLMMVASSSQTYTDTLRFGDACFRDKLTIRGIDAPFQAAELEDDTLNFGSVLVGGVRRLTLGLRNTGNMALRVDSVSVMGSSDFSLGNLGQVTLTPEGMRTWNVDFAPSTAGEHQAVVTLHSEIGDHVAVLMGSGTPSASVPMVTDASISVYPNPATRSVSIATVGESFGGSTTFRVIDHRGAVVLERTAQDASSRIELDVSSLPVGAYLIEIADPDKLRVVKFAIDR